MSATAFTVQWNLLASRVYSCTPNFFLLKINTRHYNIFYYLLTAVLELDSYISTVVDFLQFILYLLPLVRFNVTFQNPQNSLIKGRQHCPSFSIDDEILLPHEARKEIAVEVKNLLTPLVSS